MLRCSLLQLNPIMLPLHIPAALLLAFLLPLSSTLFIQGFI
jgi:hypothetical protein